MDDSDRLARQLGIRIERLESRIIPLGDLTQEDLGEGWAVNDEFTGPNALEVHDRHDAAHYHWELRKTALIELFAGKGSVTGTEDNGLGLNLFDAAPRAELLIVKPLPLLLLVGVGPLGIDRIGKCCPGARYVGCTCADGTDCERACKRTGSRQSRNHIPHWDLVCSG